METPKEKVKAHRGLSPSSLSLYQTCQRRYWHKKVAETPPDDDYNDDVESLNVGKAFHKCLEDVKHDLDGYSFAQVVEVAKAHGLDDRVHAPMLFAMLTKYKAVHKRAGLRALACEVVIETEAFYGFVDVILTDASGGWWIGDMKTAASYRPDLIPSLPLHPQLNLYAAHANVLADALELDLSKFLGCRYRLTTKSKLKRGDDEKTADYVKRLGKAIKSIDFILPKEIMNPPAVYAIHEAAAKEIEKAAKGKLEKSCKSFGQNLGSCFNYFRPCEFWSRCHGKNFTNLMELDSVTSEGLG